MFVISNNSLKVLLLTPSKYRPIFSLSFIGKKSIWTFYFIILFLQKPVIDIVIICMKTCFIRIYVVFWFSNTGFLILSFQSYLIFVTSAMATPSKSSSGSVHLKVTTMTWTLANVFRFDCPTPSSCSRSRNQKSSHLIMSQTAILHRYWSMLLFFHYKECLQMLCRSLMGLLCYYFHCLFKWYGLQLIHVHEVPLAVRAPVFSTPRTMHSITSKPPSTELWSSFGENIAGCSRPASYGVIMNHLSRYAFFQNAVRCQILVLAEFGLLHGILAPAWNEKMKLNIEYVLLLNTTFPIPPPPPPPKKKKKKKENWCSIKSNFLSWNLTFD